jgi:hypothetical protein
MADTRLNDEGSTTHTCIEQHILKISMPKDGKMQSVVYTEMGGDHVLAIKVNEGKNKPNNKYLARNNLN